MTKEIQVILYPAAYKSCSSIALSMDALANSGFPMHVSVLLGKNWPGRSEIIAKGEEIDKKRNYASFELVSFTQSWQITANQIAKDCEAEKLLFLASGALIDSANIEALLKGLNDSCAGLNPLILDYRKRFILFQGYVADSQMRLHHLYEGIEVSSPLASKKRYFQLASGSVFLLSRKDFLGAGGLDADQGSLTFIDFSIRLRQMTGRQFTVWPHAAACYENELEETEICGTWNSLAQWGKVAPETLRPDYAEMTIADGIAYKTTAWLNEAAVLPVNFSPWIQWQRDPNPQTLLSWLATCPASDLQRALEIVRRYPALMPKQFRYYELLAEQIGCYATKNGLLDLQESISTWRKRAKSFHYGELRKGMELLQAAKLYEASLDRCPAVFDAWLELSPPSRQDRIKIGCDWPKIAIVVPTYNPEPTFFTQAIDSVLAQSYPDWELCLIDDNSSEPFARKIIEGYSRSDKRIKYAYRQENGHICRATNTGLELVTAPWAGFLDHDDLLAPDALLEVASIVAHADTYNFIYSDEDHVDRNNVRRTPIFRSDFDPVLHFIGHLSVYRTTALREAGFLRPGYEGTQFLDLSLRINDACRAEQVFHIPKILYHWRIHEGSTAGSARSKSYIGKSAQMALEDAALRAGQKAKAISAGKGNFFKLFYTWPDGLSGAIVLLPGQESQMHPTVEDCCNKNPDISAYRLSSCGKALPLEAAKQGKWSVKRPSLIALKNAARDIKEEVILFLSEDLIPLPGCALEQMLIMASFPYIALVGANLWHNGRLWQGGEYPSQIGLPFALLRGIDKAEEANFCWGQFLMSRTVLGVSDLCFAIKKNIFLSVDNFKSGYFAMADLSLQLGERGLYTAISTWAQFSAGAAYSLELPTQADTEGFLEQWGEKVRKSGLRNPNLKAAPDNDWTLILPEKISR